MQLSINSTGDSLTLKELRGDGKDDTVVLNGTGADQYIQLDYASSASSFVAVDRLVELMAQMNGLVPATTPSTYTLTQLVNVQALISGGHP